MPYPQNFQVAKEVESIVQQSGVTPATIAIIDGIPCIGETFFAHLWFNLWCVKNSDIDGDWCYWGTL